jgi:MATE family multidrug resistance protein
MAATDDEETNKSSAGADDCAETDGVLTFKGHLKQLISLSIPIVTSSILLFTLPMVDLAFVGHLGKRELAACALATTWFNLLNHMMNGFATALDTLLSQSFGALDFVSYKMWTKTGFLLMFLLSVVMGGLLALCEPVMVLLGQDKELAHMAGQFCVRLTPGIFPFYGSIVLTKFFQIQNILLVSVVVGFVANMFNVLANYVLIYKTGLGFLGAPWATTLCRFFQFFAAVAYCYWKKGTRLKDTWPSMRQERLGSFSRFFSLAIPGAVMLSLEAWAFEVSTILAGLLGTVTLDAHSITINIAGFLFLSCPFAIGIATSIRVGRFVGEQRAADAKKASFVGIALGAFSNVLIGVIFLLPLRNQLGWVFSNSSAVVDIVSGLIPIVFVFMVSDGIQAAIAGTLRGLGKQRVVVFLNMLGLWLIGMPVAAVLTFGAHIGVYGLWWGLTVGLTVTSLVGMLVLFRVDFEKEIEMRKSAAVGLSVTSQKAVNVVPVGNQHCPTDSSV